MNIKTKRAAAALILILIISAVDQALKLLITSNMKLYDEIPVIGQAFTIHYIRNTGSAWGMFSNHTWLLTIVSIFALVVIGYVYFNMSADRYRILRICLIFVAGGAVGNIIDRIRLHYVVDYLYIKLINFPVFNFADMCVTIPLFLMLILLIFKYKQDDIDVILGDKVLTEDGEYVEKRSRK